MRARAAAVAVIAVSTVAAAWIVAGPDAPAPAEAGAGPSVERVRRVTLQESAELYVARPGGLAVDDRGHLLLTDFFQKWIVEFGPDGRFVARYGAPGSGPGEFTNIGETVLALDSLVGAQDYRARVFHFFRRGTGEYVGGRRIRGVASTGKVVGGAAWLANIDVESGLGMTRWPLAREEIGPRSALLPPLEAHLAPIPAEYLASEPIRGTYPIAHAAPWTDSVLVGFAAGPQLLVIGPDGAVADSVSLPALRRRGIPASLVEEMSGRRFDARRLLGRVSGLYGLSRTADGHVVAVHLDPTLHTGNRITGRLFVSLLAPARDRACVDREIPVSDVSQPLVALRGDSLYVVEQHVDGADASSTTVTLYHVDARGCAWTPLPGSDPT